MHLRIPLVTMDYCINASVIRSRKGTQASERPDNVSKIPTSCCFFHFVHIVIIG